MEKSDIDIAREIFDKFLKGETSRNGVAIPDCRGKETMVATRYGGDVIFSFFNNKTKKVKFDFVLEMSYNGERCWNGIFKKLIEIKAKLKQK